MLCDEKLRLVLERNQATQDYSNAVTNLNAKAGISAHGEYQQLKRIVDDRRSIMDRAFVTLDKHVSEHGC
jgi:hypothetical protein